MTDSKPEDFDLEAMAAKTKAFEEVGKIQREFGNISTEGTNKAVAKAHKDSGIKEKKDDKPLPTYPTFKYSRPFLHEAVILEGVPRFISYAPRFDKIQPFKDIKEPPSRILRPPNREEYPYTPYEFATEQELAEYLKQAKAQTIDLLYQKAKDIVKKYNDQDDYKLNLLAIDIVWSYFQDKFGTTHYVGIVGDNDSGKSSIGNTFEAIGYRAVNMTSPTAPNVFRTLGNIEPGQCTLILDEADKIDESTDMMSILKSGNDYTKRVPKTNTNLWKVEWFCAYCLKIIIAEKSPSRFKAKGLLDRMLSFNTSPGEAPLDIKEVANPRGDKKLEEALTELLDFRKLMLVYRLIHFENPVADVDIGIERRNRELCKPCIRLFYGSRSQKEVEETFQTFINTKNSKKTGSMEAILLPVIIDFVEEKDKEALSSEVWDFIKQNLEGEVNPYDPNEYRSSEYTLYKNTITKLLEDKFGAEYRHTNKGGKITFRFNKLQKLQKSYYLDVRINTKLKSDGSDSSDGSQKKDSITEGSILFNNLEIPQENEGKNTGITQNNELEGPKLPLALPHEPSLPSLPSPLFRCYHKGCDFHTKDVKEYRRHGTARHLKNPLLFPSKFEIEKYGLRAQGKEWEI